MDWREEFSKEPFRSYVILSILLLGVIIALPMPVLERTSLAGGVLLALWTSLVLLVVCCLWKAAWVRLLAFISMLLGLAHALSTGYWINFVTLVVILLWARRRFSKLALALFFTFLFQGELKAQPPFVPNQFKLDDLASCGSLEKIPWQFRPDGRQVRKLFEEQLRLGDEEFFWWELYQVMNQEGAVTFVFRRSLPDGSHISIAGRDLDFVRVHSTKEKSKRLVSKTLKHLINRPALIFQRADGTVVNYMPGSVGKATIEIQFAMTTGAYLPPVYIRGNFCDRPSSLSEGDVADKSFGKVNSQVKPSLDDAKK